MTRRALPLLALLLASSCTKPEPPKPAGDAAGTTAAPVEEEPGPDTLVIAAQVDAESFMSVVYQSNNDSRLIEAMFLALTDSEFDCRLSAPPLLAERYEHPDDSLSITFYLRKDVKWSDGVPVTAKDVAFTYDLVADPKVASPRLSHIQNMKEDARPRVLDDYTVRFEFKHAYDRFSQIAHCGLEILPEHVLSKFDRASLRGTDFEKAPVVSGPWTLGKWDKDQALHLVPNPAYSLPDKPKLARVIFKVVPDYSARLIELESGSVDMIETFQTMDDITRMKKVHPEIKQYKRGYRFLDYVAWNLLNPLFQEKEVRQALTMAIDRQKLIRDLMTTPDGEVLAREAVSTITPELCDYQSDGIEVFPFDPAKAKEVLASHGWKDGDGDGIVEKDGKPFRFELLTNSGNARRAKASVIIQANLRAVGVDAQLQQVETNTFFERLRKKDFESALSGWAAALFVDPSTMWHSDSPTEKHEFNFCSYANPRVDELIDLGMRTPKLEDQIPIWKEMQALIYEDQPYTFLFWRDEVAGLHHRVRDAKIDILSECRDLEQWWVPKSQVMRAY